MLVEMDYDAGGAIRHAEVLGGYASLDACRDAMPKVMAIAVPRLEKGLTPQLECSGVRRVVQESEETRS